jgi:hypothetical protein
MVVHYEKLDQMYLQITIMNPMTYEDPNLTESNNQEQIHFMQTQGQDGIKRSRVVLYFYKITLFINLKIFVRLYILLRKWTKL